LLGKRRKTLEFEETTLAIEVACEALRSYNMRLFAECLDS